MSPCLPPVLLLPSLVPDITHAFYVLFNFRWIWLPRSAFSSWNMVPCANNSPEHCTLLLLQLALRKRHLLSPYVFLEHGSRRFWSSSVGVQGTMKLALLSQSYRSPWQQCTTTHLHKIITMCSMVAWSHDRSLGTVGACISRVRFARSTRHLRHDAHMCRSRDIHAPIYGDMWHSLVPPFLLSIPFLASIVQR